MNGHHEVQVFAKPAREGAVGVLPEGWKPFAATIVGQTVLVVARRWVRGEGDVRVKA